MPRKIAISTAVAFAAFPAWGGCTATPRIREPALLQEKFASTNDRVSAVVYSGFGAFESSEPKQTPFEEFLFGPQSISSRRLRTPQGIAAVGEKLWVCDQGYPDVLQIDPGSGQFRSASTRVHRPASPVGVALDDQENVYIADATKRSVLVYAPDRSLLQELSPDEAFEPNAVFIHDGLLFVTDRGNRQIARYDLSANTWLTSLAPPAGQRALAVPAGITVTKDGVILVTDALLGLIHRVDGDGHWLAPVGSRGRGAGQLVRPIGICCTPGGLIAVADAARQAVIVFGPDGGHVIDIERSETATPGWSLPTGIVCLHEKPIFPGLGSDTELQTGDWIVVSDMLGENGLALIHIGTGHSAAATAVSEGGR